MLRVLGSNRRLCNGLSRREMLRRWSRSCWAWTAESGLERSLAIVRRGGRCRCAQAAVVRPGQIGDPDSSLRFAQPVGMG